MLFNSISFLIFLPVVVLLYFSIPHKYRWIILLVSSYYFYMSWKPEFIILIIISTIVDYGASHNIVRSKSKPKRIFFLCFSLLSNFALLFSFKYFNFFNNALGDFLRLISIPWDPVVLSVILPVGISFYTFQTVGYTIDVYRGVIKPERHFGIFAVYVSFFPQLVAGPIERAKNLLPQFYEKHKFSYTQAADGIKLMLWGFFKKIVVADRLAVVVNAVYNNTQNYTGIPLILATVFFAFQIYCDFSGYCDIAIGAAQVMGFRLMDNFKRPYFSRSISEFWKRWHISLSTWFRDYLYISIGGNRVSIPRWYLNIFIVFVVSGLWHGANWTFVIWGALHGFYMMFGALTQKVRDFIAEKIGLVKLPKLRTIIQVIIVFILADIGWVFFRANNVSDAVYVLTHIFPLSLNFSGVYFGAMTRWGLIVAFAAIIFMESIHFMQEHFRMRQFLSNKPVVLRWTIYLALIFIILLFGVFNETPFIYFQF
ncbi:MBOAT family protein [Candidatus Woesearchaeota archaeon]|nr:MBOAT family protein [Candidatus Woesearchaeota archaeon]